MEETRQVLVRPSPWHDAPASPTLAAFLRRAFGEEIGPQEAVDRVIREVRAHGDAALVDLTFRLDGVEVSAIEVSRGERARAYDKVDTAVIDALHLAAERVEAFHRRQVRAGWMDFQEGTGQVVRPLRRVGLYVPGGRAAYPSTVLMTAIPARVAGVGEVFVATPAREGGQVAPATLVACDIAKVDRVFRIGGMPAIAALAFGTESVPAVDKVCGPGNYLVQQAKKAVFGVVGIDALQGPTETVVLADSSASPVFCAADLLAQAEHDVDARPMMMTTSETLVPRVQREVQSQLRALPQESAAHVSWEANGVIALVESMEEAVVLCNDIAPEHLCLLVRDPWPLVGRLTNAGGIFVGQGSPEVLGDYVAGPSHVMPTAGSARFSSPLSVYDFLKVTSIVAMTAEAVARTGEAAVVLGKAEGLPAHARAVEVRLEGREEGLR
ncbi:MAG: histidinol dehydrogenase [Chloroflexi bacterium]|nr:histidinol dehydrogenase [Chloroflexota bacterium]